jgi:signal transduction histidine kinase
MTDKLKSQLAQTISAHHAANQKDIFAQYWLGVMYMEGQGVPVNFDLAKEPFQKLVEALKWDKEFYPYDVKQWVFLLAQEKLRAIEEKIARQELEEIIAMFAHKFRGPLLNLQYNAEHKNQKKRTVKAVRTMTALLDIFSIISTDAVDLRQKISQDKQGDRTLITVLEKSLLLAIIQLLTVENMERIVQHYLTYAKKTAQLPSTATREQLMDHYLDIWENLQAEWENSFMEVDDLTGISVWLQKNFFPIQIVGFNESPISFKRYGATESVLVIVMTEIILNAIKYYSATTAEPVIMRWEFQQDVCKLICENPTTQMESESSKGSHKGHSFLNRIAQKLEGHFTHTLVRNRYTAELTLPRYLFIEEKV